MCRHGERLKLLECGVSALVHPTSHLLRLAAAGHHLSLAYPLSHPLCTINYKLFFSIYFVMISAFCHSSCDSLGIGMDLFLRNAVPLSPPLPFRDFLKGSWKWSHSAACTAQGLSAGSQYHVASKPHSAHVGSLGLPLYSFPVEGWGESLSSSM